MKTFLITALIGIWSFNLYAQNTLPQYTSYTANIDFYVGTWRYENPQTGEEFILRLRKTSRIIPLGTNATEYVVGAYTYKKHGQIVTDCMNKFDQNLPVLDMPVCATNSSTDPSSIDPNKLRMYVSDFGKFAPNGDVKWTGSNELSIVSSTTPNQIHWILRNDRGPVLEDEMPPFEFSIPTDMILTRVQTATPPGDDEDQEERC